MSRSSDSLFRALTDLETVLAGTGVRPIDIALDRAEDWAQTDSWLQTELSPGDDTIVAAPSFDDRERRDKRKVVARATCSLEEIPKRVKRIEAECAALRMDVAWLVATVDPSKLPPAEASCESCRRVGEMGKSKIGGHFAPVWKDRSKKFCRWCAEYHAVAKQLPPLEAVELYHSQSPRAAGLWLARMAERKTA